VISSPRTMTPQGYPPFVPCCNLSESHPFLKVFMNNFCTDIMK
jgi:hypothetical protein